MVKVPTYRPDIDGLRGIAVLSVVLFHLFPSQFSGGYIGVDIFFVISGYLISSIIISDLRTGTFSFCEFYARRLRRIFPALLLVLFLTLPFAWYLLLENEFVEFGRHVFAGVAFFSNIALLSESGYFDSAAAFKPLQHLWSLGIEEQFYLFWPFILTIAHQRKLHIPLLMTAIISASFIYNLILIDRDPLGTFYLPFTRIWELLVGASLVHYHPKSSARLRHVTGLILVVYCIFFYTQTQQFPGWRALIPTIGSALIISAQSKKLLTHQVLIGTGLISYPLYLWHWPLLSFANILGTQDLLTRSAILVLSFILAALTHSLIEVPIRYRLGRRTLVSLTGAGIALCAFGFIIERGFFKSRLSDSGLNPVFDAKNDWGYPPKTFEQSYSNGHFQYSRKSGEKYSLFIGDSHIEQYAPRIETLLNDQSKKYNSAVFSTLPGCPPVPNVGVVEHPDCAKIQNKWQTLSLRQEFSTVIVGACWHCYFSQALTENYPHQLFYEGNGEQHLFRGSNGRTLALESLGRFLKQLAQTKEALFLVLDIPWGPPFDPRQSIKGSRWGTPLYQPALFLPRTNEYSLAIESTNEIIRDLAERAGAQIIDPFALLCDQGGCRISTNQHEPIFRDGDHLRASFISKQFLSIDKTVSH